MPPYCTVALPSGYLGLTFKGKIPKILNVKKDSPVYGICKKGFTFLELELGDGSKIAGLNTYELAATLQEHSEDTQRKLKLEMTLPSESVIDLKQLSTNGQHHGLIIEDKEFAAGMSRPIVIRMEKECSFKREIRVGMIIETIKFDDGYEMTGFTAKEINEALNNNDNAASVVNTIVLKSPDNFASLSAQRCVSVLPPRQTIDIPKGNCEEIGLKLTSSKNDNNMAKISQLKSPLDCEVRPGYTISKMNHPEGHEFTGLNGPDLTACIDATSTANGRVLTLLNRKEPKKDCATIKLKVPTNIDSSFENLGVKITGESAIINSVKDSSPFKGMMPPGFRIETLAWMDGTKFDNLTSSELEEVMEVSSGQNGRILYLTNSPGPVVHCTLPKVTKTNPSDDESDCYFGITFKGTPPQILQIDPLRESLLETEINVKKGATIQQNMVVDTLTLPDGTIYYQMSTSELKDVLKSTSHLENRKIRFIKPNAGVLLTPQPTVLESTEEGEMNILLPRGKLGLRFKKGSETPVILSKVNENSPLHGVIPSGCMVVDYITIQNQKFMELAPTEFHELLLSTSDLPNRRMKLWNMDNSHKISKIPDEVQVKLPKGKLGCKFAGNLPVLTTFLDDSLIDAANVPHGMFVDRIFMADENDENNKYFFSQTGMNTAELVRTLKLLKDQDGRTLIFKNIKTQAPSPRETILPSEITISLPTGKLGIHFKKEKNRKASILKKKGSNAATTNTIKVCMISNIDDDSPLLSGDNRNNIPFVGMIVDRIMIPEKSATFSGMTHKEAARIISDTDSITGRSMILKSPDNYWSCNNNGILRNIRSSIIESSTSFHNNISSSSENMKADV